MALTTIFLHSFETIFLILVLATLFRIRKHYLLSSQTRPKTRQKPRQQQQKQTLKNRSEKALHNQLQTKFSSNHYFQTLPEPEVSIAPETEDDYSIDYAIEVSPEPFQAPAHPKKSILNNYIDDFFADAPVETPAVEKAEFIPFQPRPTANI